MWACPLKAAILLANTGWHICATFIIKTSDFCCNTISTLRHNINIYRKLWTFFNLEFRLLFHFHFPRSSVFLICFFIILNLYFMRFAYCWMSSLHGLYCEPPTSTWDESSSESDRQSTDTQGFKQSDANTQSQDGASNRQAVWSLWEGDQTHTKLCGFMH